MLGLSIVIINWNTQQLLRECLESIRENPPLDTSFEVIVVDNGSEDGSIEMLREDFGTIVRIENEANRGFAAANNQGFEIARGDLVLMLNSDTLIHGHVLDASVDYMKGNPGVAAMGCRVLNTDGTVQLTCSEFPTLTNQFLMASGLWKLHWPKFCGKYLMTDWSRDTEREVDVVTGCYLMTRKSVLQTVGVLDEDFFFFGEEADWCLRVRNAGWQLRFAPVGCITHHGSASARKLNQRRDLLLTGAKVRLHEKHFGRLSAIVCWFIAILFNTSRALYWSLKRFFSKSEFVKERAVHFRGVVAGLADLMPSRLVMRSQRSKSNG